MTEKTAKPTTKRVRSPKPKPRPRQPSHIDISKRAYFIYLEEGRCDELQNWLRAERDLSVA